MFQRIAMCSTVVAFLLGACTPLRPEPEPVPQPGPLEQALRAAASGGAVPADFAVTYSDMHGMHGGTTVSLAGDGAYEWVTFNPGQGREAAQGRVPEQAVRDVIALMVQLRAWEQQTPDRMPVPDESRAGLMIRAGGEEARMWEWYNDMATNNRLIQVARRLTGLRSLVQPGAQPGP